MKKFEDDVLKFIIPVVTGKPGVTLSRDQLTTMSGWICLIAILAEYTDPQARTVSKADMLYLKRKRKPPETWAIFIADSVGPIWTQAYAHHTRSVRIGVDERERRILLETSAYNTQLASFGMGKLFVHLYSCPSWRLLSDFEIAAKARGLVQIWPLPPVIWPFSKGKTKLPPKLTLTDEEADLVADAFKYRSQALSGELKLPS